MLLTKIFFLEIAKLIRSNAGRNQPEDEAEPSKIQLRETRVYLNIGGPKIKLQNSRAHSPALQTHKV